MYRYQIKLPAFILFFLFFLCFKGIVAAQPVVLQTNDDDTLLPVFDRYSNVFKVTSKGGKYYTMGAFSHLSANHGNALIVDTATNTVITPQKWRVNGIIKTAVPDGAGGYYIGGLFTKIGDSTRRYLARIDASGKPMAWHPQPDSFVNVLIKRNDTLFIGGSFRKFSGITRYCFAMYSLISNTLLGVSGISGGAPPLLTNVNDMFLVKDTLVYGGTSNDEDVFPIINKFDFKNNTLIPFNLQFTQYGEIKSMQLSPDSSTLIYNFYSNGDFIRGVNFQTGQYKYFLRVYIPAFGSGIGEIYKIKTVGNTTYAVGAFDGLVFSDGNTRLRKGFAGFNTYTGDAITTDLQADGFVYYIEKFGNQLVVSGKFTEIAGQPRNNMAVLDTGSLALLPWSLSPTDELTAMCMQNGKTFVAGEFRGLFSVKRNGFAAIDANTNAVTPWSPPQHPFIAAKRLFVVGDTLFLLGIKAFPNANYVAELKLYSITTGAEYPLPDMQYSQIRDCVVEGNYLYVSADKKLRRYALPGLPLDQSWGTDWNNNIPTQNVHDPIHIIVDSTKIYTVGDTRYQDVSGNFSPRRGYVARYNKSSGTADYISYYEDSLPLYDGVFFEGATLSDNKLYITGIFKKLNGLQRKNMVGLNASNGSILNFQANFVGTSATVPGAQFPNTLLVRDGKLWYTGPGFNTVNNTSFGRFGAIDTSNGLFQSPPLVSLKTLSNRYYNNLATDFILTKKELVIVGSFDDANGVIKGNIVRYKLVPQYDTSYIFIGNGNWDIAANWQDNLIPPITINNDILIVIDPVINGECLLTRGQIIPAGSTIILKENKKLRVTGSLKLQGE